MKIINSPILPYISLVFALLSLGLAVYNYLNAHKPLPVPVASRIETTEHELTQSECTEYADIEAKLMEFKIPSSAYSGAEVKFIPDHGCFVTYRDHILPVPDFWLSIGREQLRKISQEKELEEEFKNTPEWMIITGSGVVKAPIRKSRKFEEVLSFLRDKKRLGITPLRGVSITSSGAGYVSEIKSKDQQAYYFSGNLVLDNKTSPVMVSGNDIVWIFVDGDLRISSNMRYSEDSFPVSVLPVFIVKWNIFIDGKVTNTVWALIAGWEFYSGSGSTKWTHNGTFGANGYHFERRTQWTWSVSEDIYQDNRYEKEIDGVINK